MFRSVGQSGSGPLMSNVRQHEIRSIASAKLNRNCQEQMQSYAWCRSSGRSRNSTNFNASGAKVSFPPEVQSGIWHRFSSNRRFLAARKTQATCPLAGSSLVVHLAKVQEQAVLCDIEALMKAGRMAEAVNFRQALAHTRTQMPKPCFKVPRSTVLPNPSIERTSTGLAHSAPQVYVPLCGPSRLRPAHVKR
jgi:hypothetical protein